MAVNKSGSANSSPPQRKDPLEFRQANPWTEASVELRDRLLAELNELGPATTLQCGRTGARRKNRLTAADAQEWRRLSKRDWRALRPPVENLKRPAATGLTTGPLPYQEAKESVAIQGDRQERTGIARAAPAS